MVDRDNREDWRRERSLLALGQAVRGDDDPSLVSIGDKANRSWREDAAERHRAAREEREARLNPPPADAAEPGRDQPRMISDETQPDWDARDGYSRAQSRDENRSASDRSPAASEYRHAEPSHAGLPLAADQDSQEWKPLIDPMQVAGGITRSKALILSTTILGAALGVAIALSTPKKYEATTELTIEPGDLKLSDRDLTQSVGQPDAALAVVETRIKMATSGKVLDEVVKELNLVNDPEFNGQGSGRLGVMSFVRSMLSRRDEPAGTGEVRRQALAVGNLADSLSVDRTGKTFVISISATTQSGEKSALIANTTRDVFQREIGQYQSDMAERATSALTSKLDELRKGVEKAERNVEDFRAKHDLVDAQGRLISDDQMLKLNDQLSVARARTLELNARAASARSLNVNSVLNGTLPEEINSNMMSELRSQYSALKQEADRAAIKFGPRHPELQALNAQLAGARERISAELQRIAASLQVDLKRSIQLEQDLSSRLAQAKVQSGDVNNNLVSLRELEREAAAKRSVYEQYLLRAKETSEQKDVNSANINMITPARPPLEAKGPSRAVMALAGLLAGLFAGIGLGALRGVYASLRASADARSRRGTEERGPIIEDNAYKAAAPRPSSLVATAAGGRSGFFASLSNFMQRRSDGSADTDPGPSARAWDEPAPQVRHPQPEMPPRRDAEMQHQEAHAHRSDQAKPAKPSEATHPSQAPSPYPQPPAEARQAPADQQNQIDEIRASLREFREAVRELTESRSRRRYF